MPADSTTWWSLAVGFRRRYAAAIIALSAATFLSYLIPVIGRATIDAIVVRSTDPSSPLPGLLGGGTAGELEGRLWRAAVAIAGLAALAALLTYFKGRWTAQAAEGMIRQLRNRLCHHLQRLPAAYHDRAETGDLVQRCTSDVETVRHFLAVQAVEVGRGVLLLATVIPIMIWMDPAMTLVALAGLPLIVGFSVFFFLRIKPAFLAMDEAEGRMTTTLQENLTGIRVVRAFARQAFEREKFDTAIGDYRNRHYRLIGLLSVYYPISDIMVFGQQAAVLLAGAAWVRSGRISIGTLVAFLLFVGIYIWPIRQLGRILTDLGKAMVSWGRIREVLEQPSEPEVVEGSTPIQPPSRCDGQIQFDQVTFAFGSGRPALDDVSFAVEPGQTLAIVGASGAGKTTIVNLLLRMYDGIEGRILLDGRPIDGLPRSWVRQQISVVMQEPFLFSKTVRENIALGRRDAQQHELFEAAHEAAVHEAILAMDKGYETVIGERGVTLSGGQRQRVALARALLQEPAILILDDALSSVDTSTETMILQALRERRGQHTTLVIAHRVSTLRHADKILVLDAGRVQQFGTHQTLSENDGIYQRLWKLQSFTSSPGSSDNDTANSGTPDTDPTQTSRRSEAPR